jgi:hypothetical protein
MAPPLSLKKMVQFRLYIFGWRKPNIFGWLLVFGHVKLSIPFVTLASFCSLYMLAKS